MWFGLSSEDGGAIDGATSSAYKRPMHGLCCYQNIYCIYVDNILCIYICNGYQARFIFFFSLEVSVSLFPSFLYSVMLVFNSFTPNSVWYLEL